MKYTAAYTMDCAVCVMSFAWIHAMYQKNGAIIYATVLIAFRGISDCIKYILNDMRKDANIFCHILCEIIDWVNEECEFSGIMR